MEHSSSTIELGPENLEADPRHLGGEAVAAARQLEIQTNETRSVIYMKGGSAYVEALAYGEQNNCTVAWVALYPQTGATPEATHRVAVILERVTRLDDSLTSTTMNSACMAAAQSYGPEYVFDIRELYHQDVWPKGVTQLPRQA
jgi:hypothetical protein